MKDLQEFSREEMDLYVKEMERANERLQASSLFIEKYIVLSEETKKICCTDFE